MSENMAQVLERKINEIDNYDIWSSRALDPEKDVNDLFSDLQPYLQNPDKHRKHVTALLNCAMLLLMWNVFTTIFAKPPFKWIIRRHFKSSSVLSGMRARIRLAKEDVLSEVQPGEIKIDALPAVLVRANPYLDDRTRKLILIETRCAVMPSEGFALQGLSHNMDIRSPAGAQLIDVAPSSEMEAIGQREVSVSDKGKISYSSSVEGKLGSSIKAGAGKIEATTTAKVSSSDESETSTADKLAYTPQVNRVISTAVGTTAIWQLLQTPSQTLLGTQKFSATVLVPSDATEIVVELRLGAQLEGWGPAEIREERTIKIPAASA